MCYARPMDRIPLRELRNQASRIVARARAGERIVITLDGVPTAQIGPLDRAPRDATIEELIATGRLIAPRVSGPAGTPTPIEPGGSRSLSDVVLEQRER